MVSIGFVIGWVMNGWGWGDRGDSKVNKNLKEETKKSIKKGGVEMLELEANRFDWLFICLFAHLCALAFSYSNFRGLETCVSLSSHR